MSVLTGGPPACEPGRARDRVDVDTVNVTRRRVRSDGSHRQTGVGAVRRRRRPPRRLDDRERMVGVDGAHMLVDRDAARRRNVTVRRLVGSLPDTQPRMAFQSTDDLVEQRAAREVVVETRERSPNLQPVRRGRIELLQHRDQLLRQTGGRPHRVVPNETDTGARDLRPRRRTVRRQAVERRWIRQPERKDPPAGDQQIPRRRINRRLHPATSVIRERPTRKDGTPRPSKERP